EKMAARELRRIGIEGATLLGHGDRFRHAITHRRLQIYPLVYQFTGEIPEAATTIPIEEGSRLPALYRKALAAAQKLLLEEPR
ncbi:MAG: hypothetical protein VX949_04595, partial [Planctomycetota bacterium]|nr:hypothetical protein [Planctomycetota bacterium]